MKKTLSLLLAVCLCVTLLPAVTVQTNAYADAYELPALTGNRVLDVANIALSQVGYTEDSKGGTVYGAWWNSQITWDGDYTYSDWCAMFACWCAYQAGAGLNVAYNSSSAANSYFLDWLRVNGSVDLSFLSTPQAGDFIFFSNTVGGSPVHVAVVVDYDYVTNCVTYVGGNQSDKVSKKTTLWSSEGRHGSQWVIGYGRPNYAAAGKTTFDFLDCENPVTISGVHEFWWKQTGYGDCAVNLDLNGNALDTIYPNGDGLCSFSLDSTKYANGTYTLGAKIRNIDGAESYVTRKVVINNVQVHKHTLTQYKAKAPDCTNIGWYAYEACSTCDYTTYVERPATGHAYKGVVTAPTVENQGYTTYTCANCGDSYVDDYTDPLPGPAMIGKVYYATVAEALASAKPGDTVTMVDNSHEEKTNLLVDEGVTLDVGQFDLHCRSLNILSGAKLSGSEYSRNDKWGRIYVPAATRMAMSGMLVTNDGSIGTVPVWDAEDSCYVFGGSFFNTAQYVVAVDEDAKTLSFKFIPSLRTQLMQDYFLDAGEMRNNGLRLVLRLTWPGADENGNINGEAQQDFVYSSQFVRTYMQALGNARFTFLLTGYDTLVTEEALAQMTITPMIITDSGMTFAGQTVELADYIA